MQGNTHVIDALNQVIRITLTSINQYFLHSKMLKNLGHSSIFEQEYCYAIAAMRVADRLIERVLFLDGYPKAADVGYLHIGENVMEILQCDLKLANRAAKILLNAIATAEQYTDFVTREFLENILEAQERQIDWIETQIDLTSSIGIPNYLQSNSQ